VLLVAVTIGAFCSACEDKTADVAAPSSSSTTASAKPAVKTPVARAKAVDVTALSKSLKCGGGKGGGACGVLESFGECQPFIPNPSASDARWLGEAWVVEDGKSTARYAMFRSERVASSDVASGQLPATVGFALIAESETRALYDAPKAIKAFRRGDVTKVHNLAVKLVKSRADWASDYMSHADENQVFVQTGGGAHLCARKDQRLLMVKRAVRGRSADGVYARMWPVTW